MIKPPEIYGEWIPLLKEFAEGKNDREVVPAMQAGTIPCFQLVLERFARRLQGALVQPACGRIPGPGEPGESRSCGRDGGEPGPGAFPIETGGDSSWPAGISPGPVSRRNPGWGGPDPGQPGSLSPPEPQRGAPAYPAAPSSEPMGGKTKP